MINGDQFQRVGLVVSPSCALPGLLGVKWEEPISDPASCWAVLTGRARVGRNRDERGMLVCFVLAT